MNDFGVLALGEAARERGYPRGELIEVCAWTTPRSRSRVASNSRHRGGDPDASSAERH